MNASEARAVTERSLPNLVLKIKNEAIKRLNSRIVEYAKDGLSRTSIRVTVPISIQTEVEHGVKEHFEHRGYTVAIVEGYAEFTVFVSWGEE